MAKYPEMFVKVTDGVPLVTILQRADAAMRRAGISAVRRGEFKACVPRQYALAVAYIREWCETD